VVAVEPDLEYVLELAVFGNLTWREVAVVVEDRLARSVCLIKSLCGLGFEQELSVQKCQSNLLRRESTNIYQSEEASCAAM
jgi:hypothetical protein